MSLNNETTDQVIVRPGVVEDVPFIFNSWLKSYRDASAVQGVPNNIYFPKHHDVIERVLAGQGLQVLVVCNKEHPEQIYAYLVASLENAELTIHWLYTKHPFRRLGMATQLYKTLIAMVPKSAAPVQYSHRTHVGGQLANSNQLTYNPYKAK